MRSSVPSSSPVGRASGCASFLRSLTESRRRASDDSLDLQAQERLTIERALERFRGNRTPGGRGTENQHRHALAQNEAVRFSSRSDYQNTFARSIENGVLGSSSTFRNERRAFTLKASVRGPLSPSSRAGSTNSFR